MRSIVLWPDPILRQACLPVQQVGRSESVLVGEMLRIMADHNGVGLAAPQVGVPLRIIVTNVVGAPKVLINPAIISTGAISRDKELGEEGCLSLPGVFEQVWRHPQVAVSYLSRYGKQCTATLKDLAARVVQHEVDHLDGRMITDA